MSNLVDKLITWSVCALVLFVTPVATWVSLNVMTRPDTITIAMELPQPKPVVTIYEFSPDEEITDWFPREDDDYQWTDNDELTYQVLVHELNEPDFYSASHTDEDLLCMAKNIYFEYKNQSMKGQLAVGLVTLNRVRSPYYPDTVCDVVYQNKQFSWYSDGLPDRPREMKAFETALLYASALLSDQQITDYTYGSDHYHADYVEPRWLAGNDFHVMVPVVQIETHIFYRQELKADTRL